MALQIKIITVAAYGHRVHFLKAQYQSTPIITAT